MPRKQTGRSQGRQVGRGEVRNSDSMTQIQQLWLSALVCFLQSRREACFIGSPTTTGSIRINFYVGDEKSWTTWNLHEDWRGLCLQTLCDLFEEEITEQDILRVAPWLAERASKAPREQKPVYAPSETAQVP